MPIYDGPVTTDTAKQQPVTGVSSGAADTIGKVLNIQPSFAAAAETVEVEVVDETPDPTTMATEPPPRAMSEQAQGFIKGALVGALVGAGLAYMFSRSRN